MNSIHFLSQNKARLSRIAQIIVFLALIRLISECFRLEAYAGTTLNMNTLRPFLIGALITSVSAAVMTIISFYQKHVLNIVIAILTIILLVFIKIIYHI